MSLSKIHCFYIIISTEFKEKPTLGQDELFCYIIISFPSGLYSKEPACNAGDLGSSLGWEDPLEKGMATPSSILAWRIPMDRGAWWPIVHGVTKSRTRLSN